MSKIAGLAFTFAQSAVGGRCFSIVARLSPRLLPGYMSSNRVLVVMRHPRPSTRGHLLAIPRRFIRDVAQVGPRRDEFLNGLATLGVVDGRLLSTNLGARQDVGLFHVHVLVTDEFADLIASMDAGTSTTLVGALESLERGDDLASYRETFGTAWFLRRNGLWSAILQVPEAAVIGDDG